MLISIVTVCFFAFLAGFIDSIVGGGGLVQTPALLFTFPSEPITRMFGTAKIPSLLGTSFSAYKYAQRVTFNYKFLLSTALAAFIGAFLGAKSVSLLPSLQLKPYIFGLLILVFIYTIFKKDFGQNATSTTTPNIIKGSIIGLSIGFYDGFFGPGTGSFLILAFVSILKLDFLNASANAKLVNCATNIAALIFFISQGMVWYAVAIPMAVCNIAGSYFGTRMALTRGNAFIRNIFLLVILVTILRFGYDIIMK